MQFEINRSHIILAGLVVVLVGAMVGEYYWLKSHPDTQISQDARLAGDLDAGRAETKVVTEADLERILKTFSEGIQKDVREAKAEITGVVIANAYHGSTGGGRATPRWDTPDTGIDLDGGAGNTLDGGKIPLGSGIPPYWDYKDYHLQVSVRTSDGDTKYKLSQKFGMRLVTTVDSSGVPVTHGELFEYDGEGKEGPAFKFDKFETLVRAPKGKQWWWWAPHLELGGAAGADFKGSGRGLFYLGFSPFAYGLTRNDNTFRLLQVGVGYDGNLPILFVSPGGYNLGEPLPLITDLWIWPSFGISDVYMVLINIGKTL